MGIGVKGKGGGGKIVSLEHGQNFKLSVSTEMGQIVSPDDPSVTLHLPYLSDLLQAPAVILWWQIDGFREFISTSYKRSLRSDLGREIAGWPEIYPRVFRGDSASQVPERI